MDGDDLRASRARIAESAAGARRAYERALHDGVQQDLIAASVRLQLARDLVTSDPAAAIALLDELRDDVHDALTAVRDVADEIYPSVLDVRGLPDAVRHAVRVAGVAATVEVENVGRYAETVEAAAYFCCRALLSEAAVAIALRDDGRMLKLEVERAQAGDSVRDLVEAAGGTVTEELGRVSATFPRDRGSRP